MYRGNTTLLSHMYIHSSLAMNYQRLLCIPFLIFFKQLPQNLPLFDG